MPGPSTLAVHAGERPHADSGSVNTPIVASTTYRYPEMEDGSQNPYIYSRYDNPTVQALEDKVAALEGGSGARSLAFASGLGAEQALFGLLRPGDVLAVQQGVYGGSTALMANLVEPMGVQVVPLGVEAPAPGDLPAETRMVWCESITNPLLRVSDVAAWADAAHAAGAVLVVDATFASPVLQRPLDLGADVVLHSATKYLGGHSDVTAGVLTTRGDLHDALWRNRRDQGATLDPHAADRVLRGAKTLPLRVRAQAHNADLLARAAADHDAVTAVHYPGHAGHPDHERATRLLDGGFGGVLSLDLGSYDAAVAFRRAVRVILPAASLGGVESLVSLPRETSHAYATPEARARDGITDGLVRVSVGIEDAADLLEDLRRGLDAALAPDDGDAA